MKLLTVNDVEEIHEAIQNNLDVKGIVDQFDDATLPALLEYGCLNWTIPDSAPPLPKAVRDSLVGRALTQVRSRLGLRSTGPEKPRLKRIDVQPVEFQVVTDDLDDDGWKEFEIRFDRSAQSLGFPPNKAHALQAAMHEMVDNALIHASSPASTLVGYSILDGAAVFCVVDVGVGVLKSLRSHPAYQNLTLHNHAIRAAIQDGTTRFGPNTRGLGFRQIFKALAAEWGHLRFRSGNGCLTLNGEGLDADQGNESFPPILPGFQVTVCCRLKPPSNTKSLV